MNLQIDSLQSVDGRARMQYWYQQSWDWAQFQIRQGEKVTRRAWKLDSAPVWIQYGLFEQALVRCAYGQMPTVWTPHELDESAMDWEVYR